MSYKRFAAAVSRLAITLSLIVTGLVAGLVVAPQADASTTRTNCDLSARAKAKPYMVAFHGGNGHLWVAGPGCARDLGLGISGSPAIAHLKSGGYEITFRAASGNLWIAGAAGTGDTGLGVAPGTDPSIAALGNGGFEVAFHASSGDLWVVGRAGTGSTGLAMPFGESPSITALKGHGFEIAFIGDGGTWLAGSRGNQNLGFVGAGSPSVAALKNGQLVMAGESYNGGALLFGAVSMYLPGQGMCAACTTSSAPAITSLTRGGFEAAYVVTGGHLRVYGSAGSKDTGLVARTGDAFVVRPSIVGLKNGGYEVALQGSTGTLWVTGSAGTRNTGLGMAHNSSPSIAG